MIVRYVHFFSLLKIVFIDRITYFYLPHGKSGTYPVILVQGDLIHIFFPACFVWLNCVLNVMILLLVLYTEFAELSTWHCGSPLVTEHCTRVLLNTICIW